MGNSKDWLHWTVQVLQIGQSVLKWSTVSNTMHCIHGGCLVAYPHFTAHPLTALQHSGSSRGVGTCTLGAAQSTRVGMAALQFKAVKLEGPPPPTGGARSTHKRELVHPTNWLTPHSHWRGDWLWFTHQLDTAQWRDGHTPLFQLWTSSSHLVWVALVYHQLPFGHVSKAPIETLQYPCFLQLLSQQPLQTFVKRFGALQTAGVNSEQWTVQKDLCYGTICVHNMTNL